MKKTVLLLSILISSLGFSQQVLKRITQTTAYTGVEFFVLRNGTSSGNVVGTESFNSFTSATYGSVKLYDNQNVYEGAITLGDFTNIPSTVVCNGTYLVSSSRADQIPGFGDPSSPNTHIGVIVSVDTNNYKELGQGANVDLLNSNLKFTKIVLPSGNPVPTNTWIVVSSREGVDLVTGNVIIPSKRLGFKFDGTTWVLQENDWLNVPFDILVDVCDPLSNSFFEDLESKISIFPNPTSKFITIKNDTNATGSFQYEVIDLTGRITIEGKSIFNENINIESLTNGNYIIKIKNHSNEVEFRKFIKI